MTIVRVHNEDGSTVDVTEAVRTMYDLLCSSMDWGSGFLSIEEVIEVTRLAAACGFLGLDGANEQIAGYLHMLGGRCPICNQNGTYEVGNVTEHGRKVKLRLQFSSVYDVHEGELMQPRGEPASLIWPTS